jgi:hypothetical protein
MTDPAEFQWKAYKGGEWNVALRWKTGDPPEEVDNTGMTATMIFQNPTHRSALVLTEASGITLGGASGLITPALTQSQLNSLPVGEIPFRLFMNGTPLAVGTLTVA